MRKLFALGVVLATLHHPSVWANRNPEPLEAFDLTELQIAQIHLKARCEPLAYVLDPKGYLHRVQKGDHAGKHYGRVVAITKKGIKLQEVFEETPGEWKEKEAWLPAVPTTSRYPVK